MIGAKAVCDFCGAEKGSGNHWFTLNIFIHADEAAVSPSPIRDTILLISSFDLEHKYGPFDLEDTDAGIVKHACGNSCLQRFIERWTGTKSLEAPRTPAGDPAA